MPDEEPGEFDVQSYLRTHDIIFQQPPEIWEESLILGNGDMVACCFADCDALCWGIDKQDVHDSRIMRDKTSGEHHAKLVEALKRNDADEIRRIFQQGRKIISNYPYPAFKACGLSKLKFGGLNLYTLEQGEYEQRTRISDGINEISLANDGLELRCESFVSKTKNVLCVRVRGRTVDKLDISVRFERWLDPIIGRPVFTGSSSEDGFLMDHVISKKDAYAVAGRVTGLAGEMALTDTSFEYSCAHVRGEFEFEVHLAVACMKSDERYAESAQTILPTAVGKGYNLLRAEHVDAWEQFWQRSFLWHEDKFFEQVYYVSLYHAACYTGTSSIPSSNGMRPGVLHDYTAYPFFLTDVNLEQIHWPLLPSDHVDLVAPAWEFLSRNLGRIRRETKRYYGITGAFVPFSLSVDGVPIGDVWARHMMQCGGWMAELLWWCYEFTQDKALLRDKLYPFIRDTARFYLNYLTADSQGKLSAYPSVPPEQRDDESGTLYFVRNDSAGRSTIHATLKAAAEAAEILGVDKALGPKCKQAIENLADYPNNGDIILDYEGDSPNSGLHHPACLNGVYSTGEINEWGDAKLFEMAKRTYAKIWDRTVRGFGNDNNPWGLPVWTDDLSYTWLICVAARLGMPREAWEHFYDQVVFLQMRENGTATLEPPTFPQRNRRTQWDTSNHAAGIAAAVLEMYLQSHAGVIELFPGMPKEYDCGFSGLLARGAFKVTAQRRNGVVTYLSILSRAGLRCRVLNPWRGEVVRVLQGTEQVAALDPDAEFIEFDTQAESTYSILPLASRGAQLAYPEDGGILREPRSYVGPKYLVKNEDVTRTERISIGKRFSRRQVYRFDGDTALCIPALSYSVGNYAHVVAGSQLATSWHSDIKGISEHGIKPHITAFTFGGPYPECAEYWIECSRQHSVSIGITYKHVAEKPRGAISRLCLNDDLITDRLFENTTDHHMRQFTFETGPVTLSQGMNRIRIERFGHLPQVIQIDVRPQHRLARDSSQVLPDIFRRKHPGGIASC